MKRTHRFDGGRDRFHPGIVEHQAVEEGAGNAAGARLGDILGIGGQNAGLFRADGIRHSLQGAVFLGGGGERQRAGGEPSLAADPGHAGRQYRLSLQCFSAVHSWPSGPKNPDVSRFLTRRGRRGRGSPAAA